MKGFKLKKTVLNINAQETLDCWHARINNELAKDTVRATADPIDLKGIALRNKDDLYKEFAIRPIIKGDREKAYGGCPDLEWLERLKKRNGLYLPHTMEDREQIMLGQGHRKIKLSEIVKETEDDKMRYGAVHYFERADLGMNFFMDERHSFAWITGINLKLAHILSQMECEKKGRLYHRKR